MHPETVKECAPVDMGKHVVCKVAKGFVREADVMQEINVLPARLRQFARRAGVTHGQSPIGYLYSADVVSLAKAAGVGASGRGRPRGKVKPKTDKAETPAKTGKAAKPKKVKTGKAAKPRTAKADKAAKPRTAKAAKPKKQRPAAIEAPAVVPEASAII